MKAAPPRADDSEIGMPIRRVAGTVDIIERPVRDTADPDTKAHRRVDGRIRSASRLSSGPTVMWSPYRNGVTLRSGSTYGSTRRRRSDTASMIRVKSQAKDGFCGDNNALVSLIFFQVRTRHTTKDGGFLRDKMVKRTKLGRFPASSV